jgi:hypothetical protein
MELCRSGVIKRRRPGGWGVKYVDTATAGGWTRVSWEAAWVLRKDGSLTGSGEELAGLSCLQRINKVKVAIVIGAARYIQLYPSRRRLPSGGVASTSRYARRSLRLRMKGPGIPVWRGSLPATLPRMTFMVGKRFVLGDLGAVRRYLGT